MFLLALDDIAGIPLETNDPVPVDGPGRHAYVINIYARRRQSTTDPLPFKAPEEVASHGNDTHYGLAAAVWTKDISKAHRLAERLRAGTVWINCYNMFDAASPFGGYKQSGFGREMGKAALELYTQIKSVWLNLGEHGS